MSRRTDWPHLEYTISPEDFPEDRRRTSEELAALLHWREVPPTNECEERLAALIQQIGFEEQIGAEQLGRWRGSAEDNQQRLKILQQALAEAQERDARRDALPEECECYGAGGWGLRFTRYNVWAFDHYCPCPVGQTLQSEHARQWANAQSAVEDRRRTAALATFVNDQVPRHFREITAGRFPVTTSAQRTAIAAAGKWALTADEDFEKPWLLFRGPPGRGKTSLAISIARTRLKNGLSADAIFTSLPDLLLRIKATFDRGARQERDTDVMSDLADADLLILDDLGAENTTVWVIERLFAVLNQRHGSRAPTIVTTNLTTEQLVSRLGERLAWRIAEMSEVVSLEKCPNLRAQNSRSKLEVVSA